MDANEFHPPLDAGIAPAVLVLRAAGVATFESCQGGPGHAFPVPTVRFHASRPEAFHALQAAVAAGLPVYDLRQVWPIVGGRPKGPCWELTFAHAIVEEAAPLKHVA